MNTYAQTKPRASKRLPPEISCLLSVRSLSLGEGVQASGQARSTSVFSSRILCNGWIAHDLPVNSHFKSESGNLYLANAAVRLRVSRFKKASLYRTNWPGTRFRSWVDTTAKTSYPMKSNKLWRGMAILACSAAS